MEVVHDAYRHGRYKRIGLNSLQMVSNVKDFENRVVGQAQTTEYLVPYVNHNDQTPHWTSCSKLYGILW